MALVGECFFSLEGGDDALGESAEPQQFIKMLEIMMLTRTLPTIFQYGSHAF